MKNCLMVSIVFFDSEQLLTYNQPSKNASKYPKLACAKIAILHSTDFGGLIRPLNHIFLGLSMFGAHPQGLEGIYIQVSLWVIGEVFLKNAKKWKGRFSTPPPAGTGDHKKYFLKILVQSIVRSFLDPIFVTQALGRERRVFWTKYL